jgi:hypothetical protein
VKWAGNVEHVRQTEDIENVWLENLKERDQLEDLGVDVKIRLKWILRR